MILLYKNENIVAYIKDDIIVIKPTYEVYDQYHRHGIYDVNLKTLARNCDYTLPYYSKFIEDLLCPFNGKCVSELMNEMRKRGDKARKSRIPKQRRDDAYNKLPEECKNVVQGIGQVDTFDTGITVEVLLFSDTHGHIPHKVIQKHLKAINRYVREYVSIGPDSSRRIAQATINVLPLCKLVDVTMQCKTILVLHYELKEQLINVLSEKGEV